MVQIVEKPSIKLSSSSNGSSATCDSGWLLTVTGKGMC